MTEHVQTNHSIRPWHNAAFELLFLGMVLICACYFVTLKHTLNHEFIGGALARVAHNEAIKPFQYRILVPYAAALLTQLKLQPLDSLDKAYYALDLCAVFFLVLAFRYYVSLFIKNRTVSSLSALLLFYVLPFNFIFPGIFAVHYCYDMPSILFFTLGLICLYKKKWIAFYPIFILGTLNKETTCFLTVIYLFTSWGREKPARIIGHCCAQFVIWMIIKGILFKLFIHSPGYGFELYDHNVAHLSDNLSFLLGKKNGQPLIFALPFFFSNLGFLWIPVLACYRRIESEYVRRALWVVLPYFVGMLIVAVIYEIRIFGELVPLFLLAATLILKELADKVGAGIRADNPQ